MIGVNNNGATLVGYRWFSGIESIGIVLVETEYDGLKSYIKSCSGLNEKNDLIDIMQCGTIFPVEEAKSLCNYVEK